MIYDYLKASNIILKFIIISIMIRIHILAISVYKNLGWNLKVSYTKMSIKQIDVIDVKESGYFKNYLN